MKVTIENKVQVIFDLEGIINAFDSGKPIMVGENFYIVDGYTFKGTEIKEINLREIKKEEEDDCSLLLNPLWLS